MKTVERQARPDYAGGNPRRIMAARPRKRLTKAKLRAPEGRFAVHLRALMDEKGWQIGDLHERLVAAGIEIQKPSVHMWLRGETMPKAKDLEAIGRVFGLDDPRHVLPPPL